MLHTGGIDGVAQAYIVGLGHVTRGVKVSTSNTDKYSEEKVKKVKRQYESGILGKRRRKLPLNGR